MSVNPRPVIPDIEFNGKKVLITGGTRGIGLNIGLSFARLGAQCILTYRWGDHDEDDIRRRFAELNAPDPIIIQADVINKTDTQNLISVLKGRFDYIDIFISNVSASLLIRSFDDYKLKALQKSISYSSWPLVDYLKQLNAAFERYPKYILGISSTGPDHYSYGYDFVAASKAVLETLCKYLAYRLKEEDVIINAVRTRAVKTQSFTETFGTELEDYANQQGIPENYWIDCQEFSNAILALCSGYCDAIRGQVITVDRGTTFFDNFMELYTRHKNTSEDL